MTADLLLADPVIALPGGEMMEGWLSVRGGRIDDIGTGTAPAARRVRDCGGAWILPGLVDIHVHFRDPGFTHKEDFCTGSASAAAGGVTTVVDMPNNDPLVVTPADVRNKLAALAGRSHVDFGLFALLHDSSCYVAEMAELGVAGFKWMMGYSTLNGLPGQPSSRRELRDALRRAGEAGLLVGVHAEDPGWLEELGEEVRVSGRDDGHAHGASRPPFVEALAVADAVILASEWACRLHIHHLSSAKGLGVLAALKRSLAVTVTAEACPHHLLLTEDSMGRLGTRARVNPPLRRQSDVDALWQALLDGTIQCIASDHAPHAPTEKSSPVVWDVSSGLIGVETTFSLMFDQVLAGRLPISRFVEATAELPARIVGLGHCKGALRPGYDADLLVVDPRRSTSIRSSALHSKNPDSVYDGLEVRGALASVYLRGEEVADNGRVAGERRGRYTPSKPMHDTGLGTERL